MVQIKSNKNTVAIPMYTLYPPVVDDERNSIQSDGTDQSQENDNETVLPTSLRHNFEAMHAIVRAQHRLKHSQTPPLDNRQPQKDEVRRVGDKRKHDQLEERKVELAVKTAVAVENELSRLRNGIAELEALLAAGGTEVAEEDLSDVEEITSAASFPSLPPVVLVEQNDESHRQAQQPKNMIITLNPRNEGKQNSNVGSYTGSN